MYESFSGNYIAKMTYDLPRKLSSESLSINGQKETFEDYYRWASCSIQLHRLPQKRQIHMCVYNRHLYLERL